MASSTSILAGSKLSYFPMPGRGESVRLALQLSGVEWVDNRVPGKDWGSIKPSTPWGKMPMLELADGAKLSQQRALLRFVGKLGGLYPDDPLLAARVDELMDTVEDCQVLTNSVGQGQEQGAKEAARAEAAVSGTVAALLAKIDAYVAMHGSGGFAVGSSLTVADLMVATHLCMIPSGMFDGVPATALDAFPNICLVRKTVMTEPRIAAYYAGRAADMGDFEKFICDVSKL
jgi:glutathione S-transferase